MFGVVEARRRRWSTVAQRRCRRIPRVGADTRRRGDDADGVDLPYAGASGIGDQVAAAGQRRDTLERVKARRRDRAAVTAIARDRASTEPGRPPERRDTEDRGKVRGGRVGDDQRTVGQLGNAVGPIPHLRRGRVPAGQRPVAPIHVEDPRSTPGQALRQPCGERVSGNAAAAILVEKAPAHEARTRDPAVHNHPDLARIIPDEPARRPDDDRTDRGAIPAAGVSRRRASPPPRRLRTQASADRRGQSTPAQCHHATGCRHSCRPEQSPPRPRKGRRAAQPRRRTQAGSRA